MAGKNKQWGQVTKIGKIITLFSVKFKMFLSICYKSWSYLESCDVHLKLSDDELNKKQEIYWDIGKIT